MGYPKPTGYRYAGLTTGSRKYLPFNNFASGNMAYAPGSPSAKSVSFTFSAAPANGSSLTIFNGVTNVAFTYTYSGSPGAGVIPLVAGGGTAAQAATATQVALAAQLTNWTVTNPSAGQVQLVYKIRGIDGFFSSTGTLNLAAPGFIIAGPTFPSVLPARFGKNYAFLSG